MKSLKKIAFGGGVFGLALVAFDTGAALAASPAYCALYAREYTAQFTTGSDADAAMASEHRIQEQAYYQCLNMDVEPDFPANSVYAGDGFQEVLTGLAEPADGIAEGDASAEDPLPVEAPEEVAAEQRARQRPRGMDAGVAGVVQEALPELVQPRGRDHQAVRRARSPLLSLTAERSRSTVAGGRSRGHSRD